MDRRRFSKSLIFSGAFSALSFSTPGVFPAPGKKKLIKPRRLREGDVVGLIAPGSPITDEALQKAVVRLEELGFRVKLSEHIRAQRGFNAGTDRQRLDDLHATFADNDVAAVWCVRGGYGCSRILPGIDYDLIRKNPKVLIGYSDVTALLQAVFLQTGLVGFHGPVGATELTDYTKAHLLPVVMEGRAPHIIALAEENKVREEDAFQAEVIAPGKARGQLMGGNLSLLAALAGTPYALRDVKGKLLFIEDIGEKPYRIDRMFTQLWQSVDLRQAAGIALGIFEDCQPGEKDFSLSLKETLRDQLAGLGIPVVYGLSFGHIADMCTLPVGIEAELDAESMTLTLLEPATV
jgi:muramoyltetrapeptide carboxypeptidase